MCDAGGSTANISAYEVLSKKGRKFSLRELDKPSCRSNPTPPRAYVHRHLNYNKFMLGLDAGGARVDTNCRRYLDRKLKEAYGDSPDIPDYVAEGLRDFRSNAKRNFILSSDPCRIKLGDRRLQSLILPIKNGVFSVPKFVVLYVHCSPVSCWALHCVRC